MNTSRLRDDFILFREKCINIRRDYNTYDALFFSGKGNLLLNTAPAFFNDLAEILQRDWILQVCKLMDPPSFEKNGKLTENISIKLINFLLMQEQFLTQEISSLSEKILEYGKKLTPARNKLIAHSDREHHIRASQLGETSEQELKSFLENIQAYCDATGQAIGFGPLDFSVSNCPGDVYNLLNALENNTDDGTTR